MSLPPGPRYPRTLCTLGWVLRPGAFMDRCRRRYGDTFTLRIANEGTWVMLSDPADVKQVFTGDPAVFHAGEGNAILSPVLGHHSVLLLDEGEHLAQRKLMLPSFHGERMQRYGELMASVAREEIARWPAGRPFPLRPSMQAVTLEVIMRAVFGMREGARLERLRALLGDLLDVFGDARRMLPVILLGPERVHHHPLHRRLLRPVDELVYAEIADRRADPALAERDDILSLLLQARHEDGQPMRDEELRDELMTLLIAGHETTATALSWAVERLVRHPAQLARLHDEVAAGEDVYLDAVAKETLRLRPVVAIVVRKLTRPVTIGGHDLPAGVTVAPSIYLVHRRPDVYPDPLSFRPERFLERPAGTYTWIPFGGGVRRCLGASFALFEFRTVLAEMVRGARLAPSRRQAERIRRRAITMVPEHEAEVVAA